MDDCARAGLDRQVARNCAVEDETDAPMQRRIASAHAIEGDILLDGEGAFDLVVPRAHDAADSSFVLDRQRVVYEKSVAVREDRVGRSRLKTKNNRAAKKPN